MILSPSKLPKGSLFSKLLMNLSSTWQSVHINQNFVEQIQGYTANKGKVSLAVLRLCGR